MKVYISGKITGLETSVYESNFQKAEDLLKKFGFEPINPVKLTHDHDKSWLSFMRVDLKALLDCDAIYMLDNWEESKGAKIEYDLAKQLGINEISISCANHD